MFAKRAVYRYYLQSVLILAVWLAGPPLFLCSLEAPLLRLHSQASEKQSQIAVSFD
jgi:hypothetical protein